MTTYQAQVVLDGKPADLAHVVDFVEHACQRAGVGTAARFDLQLAAEEACANIIRHAYGDAGGQFVLRFETRGRDVRLIFHDHGKPFDPEQVARPDLDAPLEERPLGGLGLHLMQQLMDEVDFTFSSEEGNTLIMVKHGIVTDAPGEGG